VAALVAAGYRLFAGYPLQAVVVSRREPRYLTSKLLGCLSARQAVTNVCDQYI
jgi:hypothetical protein